jgi:ComF family protein
MSIIENVVRLFAPHICIGCGVEQDRLLCESCLPALPAIAPRCYRCSRATEGYAVCVDCQPQTPLRRVAVAIPYDGLAKQLVHSLKFERAQYAAREMGGILKIHADYFAPDAVFVHIPTATSRVHTRGYDHAALLARAVARESGRSRRRLLARVGQARQVGASRAQRLEQLSGAFRPVHLPDIQGRHIVLVDDVLTTGTTLESAARVLLAAGAARVDALAVAQA